MMSLTLNLVIIGLWLVPGRENGRTLPLPRHSLTWIYTGIGRKRTTFSVPDNDIASDSASLLGESVHEFPPKDADDVNIKPLQPAEIITKYCPQLKAEQAETTAKMFLNQFSVWTLI